MVDNVKTKRFFLYLFIIIALGLSIRLILAYVYFGTADVAYWAQFSTYWQEGVSPYDATGAFTGGYSYAPLWFYILSFMSYLSQKLNLPFSFAIKLPLIFADLIILFVLILACRKMKMNRMNVLLTAGWFFLNPVSVLVSGYFGQFGNISVLFALLAWYFYAYSKKGTFFWLSSAMLSLSVAMKHFTIILMPVFAFIQNKLFKKLAVFVTAPCVFIITILPYFLSNPRGVISSIFEHSYGAGYWGWSGVICRSILFFFNFDVIKQPWFVYMEYFNHFLYVGIFIISFFLVKKFDLIDSLVVVFLIFYAFTTQIAPQYTLWIIPLAALKRGKYFYWYTMIGAIQLMTFSYCHHHWRLKLPFEGTISNLIPETFIIFRYLTWVVCVLWLADMLGITNFIRRKIFVQS